MYWTGRVQIACCIIGILSFFVLYCLLSVGYVGWIDAVLLFSGVLCVIGYNVAGSHESKIVDGDNSKIRSPNVLNNPPMTLDLHHGRATANYVTMPIGGKECYYCKEKYGLPPPTRTDGYVYSDSGNFSHLECMHNFYKKNH